MAAPKGGGSIFLRSFFVCCILTISSAASSKSYVPVFIWDSDGRTLFSAVSAGEKLTAKEFTDNYWSVLIQDWRRENVVVFIQDKLSLDDLTQYSNAYSAETSGGSYKNLKSFTEAKNALFLPAVDNPKPIVSSALDMPYQVHHVKDNYDVPKLKPNTHNLVLVHLPPHQGESERQYLKENDDIIGKFLNDLNDQNVHYVGVFTGKMPSRAEHFIVDHFRVARQTGNSTQDYTLFTFDNCLMFYAKKISMQLYEYFGNKTVNTVAKIDLPPNVGTVDTANSKCTTNKTEVKVKGPANATLCVKYDSNSIPNITITELTVTYEFLQTRMGYWNMASVNIDYDFKYNDREFKGQEMLRSSQWLAPVGFSFSCYDSGKLKPVANFSDSSSSENLTVGFSFTQVQVQPFGLKDGNFSRAYDCQVFFTAGIWSGVVTMFVLTIILLWGLGMIANLKTMDRFDDPKGKTITVPQAAE